MNYIYFLLTCIIARIHKLRQPSWSGVARVWWRRKHKRFTAIDNTTQHHHSSFRIVSAVKAASSRCSDVTATGPPINQKSRDVAMSGCSAYTLRIDTRRDAETCPNSLSLLPSIAVSAPEFASLGARSWARCVLFVLFTCEGHAPYVLCAVYHRVGALSLRASFCDIRRR